MHKLGFIVDMDGTMIDSMGYHAHPLPKVLEMTTGRTCVECMDLLFERPVDRQKALDDVHHKESLTVTYSNRSFGRSKASSRTSPSAAYRGPPAPQETRPSGDFACAPRTRSTSRAGGRMRYERCPRY